MLSLSEIYKTFETLMQKVQDKCGLMYRSNHFRVVIENEVAEPKNFGTSKVPAAIFT